MAGYLDTYGVREEQRWRIIRRSLIIGTVLLIVSIASYFYFRTYSQEKAVQRFLAAVEHNDLMDAYRMWCPPSNPCKYFPFEKFNQDWGPSSPHAGAGAPKVDNVDYCDSGVVFHVSYPKGDPVILWVERSTNIISPAPPDWTQCPGKHWEFKRFFQQFFSKS